MKDFMNEGLPQKQIIMLLQLKGKKIILLLHHIYQTWYNRLNIQ